jgi:hypothetical protein
MSGGETGRHTHSSRGRGLRNKCTIMVNDTITILNLHMKVRILP